MSQLSVAATQALSKMIKADNNVKLRNDGNADKPTGAQFGDDTTNIVMFDLSKITNQEQLEAFVKDLNLANTTPISAKAILSKY